MNSAPSFPPAFADPSVRFTPRWYVGTADDLIEFDFSLTADGTVVLQSLLSLNSTGVFEPFLIEPWRRPEAIEQAISLVKDAKLFLEESDVELDGNKSSDAFITALRVALGFTLQ